MAEFQKAENTTRQKNQKAERTDRWKIRKPRYLEMFLDVFGDLKNLF